MNTSCPHSGVCSRAQLSQHQDDPVPKHFQSHHICPESCPFFAGLSLQVIRISHQCSICQSTCCRPEGKIAVPACIQETSLGYISDCISIVYFCPTLSKLKEHAGNESYFPLIHRGIVWHSLVQRWG